ncbi:hypothetical protein ACFE04_017470 [Oxalis oulophora]
MWNSAENVFARTASFREEGQDEEEALRWAALERLPTNVRVRRGIFKDLAGATKEVDVSDLQIQHQNLLIQRLINAVDDDPQRFFQRMRTRIHAVGLELPKIEVRFQDFTVESFVHVGSRALPTIPNFIFNMTDSLLRQLKIKRGKRSKLTILDNISGIVRPSRLTLLLGPPSSGKTTLLLALAGRLSSSLQMSGKVTYNGHSFNEFVAQRTSAYVSQQDWHVAEMTVRETLDFAGRCQGVGTKHDMLLELARREKMAGIKPDEDLDLFMKALALGGQETELVVEYIMKVQAVFPSVSWPFESHIDQATDWFEPGVMSKKDQEQYWSMPYQTYRYIPPGKIAKAFRSHQTGKSLFEKLAVPFDRIHNHPAALSTSRYGVKRSELLKTNYEWQKLLMKRNSFIYIFKFIQMSIALFRVMGSLGRNMIVANTFGSFAMLVVMALGGYIVSKGILYKFTMFVQHFGNNNITLGKALLKQRSLSSEMYWYWIGVGVLLGYTVLFNILFTFFLAYLNPLGQQQATVTQEELQERERGMKGENVVTELRQFLKHSQSLSGKHFKQRGMVLPFQPLSMSFSNINYYVDVPLELKQQAGLEDRLQLLRIPIWWRWYYWANPIAWSLYGLLTSQYGDSYKLVTLSDGVHKVPIRQLLKDVFGFRHDFLVVSGIMVVSFAALFAVIFAYAIKSFNFQRR